MKAMRIIKVFPCVMLVLVIGLFAASGVFAIDESAVGLADGISTEDTVLNFRVEEAGEPHSASGCITESMVMGDQRRLATAMSDRQAAGSEGKRRVFVDPGECTGTAYIMPMNR